MLSSNFEDNVKDFIASDQAFTFMNGIKEHQPIGKSSYLIF